MQTQQAYNLWAGTYNEVENRTRDLEALSLREMLQTISFSSSLEIGCGTGKNTEWLASRVKHITAVDFSEEMLAKAKDKTYATPVEFKQADINSNWNFHSRCYDLVSFSLVLEHIEDLNHIFSATAKVLNHNGYVYIGELHPFKQYTGSKARFETGRGVQQLECFNHHISEYTTAAAKHGLKLIELNEYFDNDNRAELPRILAMLFQKQIV